MVYCNLYIYIYTLYIYVYVCGISSPTPITSNLKNGPPSPPFPGFPLKKSGYILTPPAIISLTSIQSQNPKETHVFCCYPRIKWSRNLQEPWFSGGDDRMTSGCSPTACLGNMFFSFFWCNKKNFSDQVHKSVVGSNNWCVPSAMLKFWYSTVELLQTNQNLWHGINGPTQSSTVLTVRTCQKALQPKARKALSSGAPEVIRVLAAC